MGAVIAIVIVIAVIGFIAYGIVKRVKQEKAMAEYALRQGWVPLPNDPSVLSHTYRNTYKGSATAYVMTWPTS